MHHRLRTVVRSSAHGNASRAVSRAAESDSLFEALAMRRADTLRAFVIGRLAEYGGGLAIARAFLAHARALRISRGAVPEASWLVGVAGGVARELAHGAAQQMQKAALAPAQKAADPGPLALPDQLRIARRLSAQFQSLSDELHDLLLLVAMGEMSIDDAGLLLGRPLDAASRRLERAMRVLRHRLHPTLGRAAA
jgi:DNA-directed RNA polymerase specialized sigma24 family protein